IHLGSQPKPYAYSYTPGDSSPGFTKCLGSIWTGKDRYLWIDLGAGPVDYGPALSGDGVLPKGEFHPLAALHGRPKSQKALLSDLASLVWSAYQVLLVPSLRIPVPFENSLIVEFVHIHGDGGSFGLDWKSIERTFMDEVNDRGLLLRDQSLSFKKYEVKLSECSICSFAIARATTSYTSRYLFDNYTLIVSEYLDSKLGKLPEEDFGRVLPVYVFDLDVSTILLLDRYHQSVAFKDMVIAVRTKSTQTVSDYSCNGHHVFTQTRELERPLVGSILQSMWGVSPTIWSGALGIIVLLWTTRGVQAGQVISAMSHFDYEMALYYLRSSDHDLYAIHSLVYHASQELEASLICFKDPPFPWTSVLLSAGIFFALFYVYAKRDKLFQNKRKQF
ncbi:hypothetical protein Pfo_030123, partial [Paulownia fortunei]